MTKTPRIAKEIVAGLKDAAKFLRGEDVPFRMTFTATKQFNIDTMSLPPGRYTITRIDADRSSK